MRYSTIIVDDEQNAVKAIDVLLTEFHKNIDVVARAYTTDEAVSLIIKHKPQLLFLDIELNDGSGFEIVEKTKDINYKLIFTTAYEQYAIKAFRANAIDYLLKPIEIEDFNRTVLKAITLIEQQKQFNNSELSNIKNNFNKISLPFVDSYDLVNQDEIIHLQADSNYTVVFTINNKSALLAKTLKEFELKLNPNTFFRIHHSHIVNLNHITKYIKGEGGEVVLSNGTRIPVSRTKKQELLSKLISK